MNKNTEDYSEQPDYEPPFESFCNKARALILLAFVASGAVIFWVWIATKVWHRLQVVFHF